MREIFKLGLLTWVTVFVLIFVFISFILFFLCSLWWLITNNMIDRSTFLLVSSTISFILSLLTIFGSSRKK